MGLRIDIDVVTGSPAALYLASKLKENRQATWKNKRNSLGEEILYSPLANSLVGNDYVIGEGRKAHSICSIPNGLIPRGLPRPVVIGWGCE